MADGEQRPSGGGAEENGRGYPIGFRCKPTIEELVEFYLLPKLLDQPTVPNEFVIEEDAYACHPEILTGNYKERGVDDDSWYFLSPRYRKYPGGDRPARRTADNRGRWKPSTGTSPSNPSKDDDDANDASTSHSKAKKKQRLYVGDTAFTENTLAYYVGPTKRETKTKWLMHELVVPETPDNGFPNNIAGAEAAGDGMLLNRYVACKIYKSPLRKWKEIDDEEEAAAEEVPTSSHSSGSAPECVGEPSSSRQQPPAKRLAVERPAASEHTGAGAPSKWVFQNTLLFPDGRPAPTRGNGGGGGNSVRMPVGAGAGGRHGQGLPELVHWPPAYNSTQGPVQVQRPPLSYGYGNRTAVMPNANGQPAPGQAPPVYQNKSMQGPVPVQVQVQRPPSVCGYGNRAAGMTSNANGQAQAPGQGPPVYSSMQGSVQVQRPPLVYGHGNRAAGMANANGQLQAAAGQGPPRRPAAATAPNSQGPTARMMRPPNLLAAGQPARLYSPRPPETEEEHKNRVYARLIDEMKLQKALQMRQTASAQPALFHGEGGDHRPAGVEAVVPPPAQLPAPHGGHPYSSSNINSNLAQRSQQQQQQQQQSSSATPAAAVKPAAAENVPSEQSVPPAPGANEGSGNGEAATIARSQHYADLGSTLAAMKNLN